MTREPATGDPDAMPTMPVRAFASGGLTSFTPDLDSPGLPGAHAAEESWDSVSPWKRKPPRRPRRPPREPEVPVEDTVGHDLRPDPLAAANGAEMMVALRAFRIWAGNPGFRVMATRAGHRAAPSTMCTALKNDELPTLDVLRAIVEGCAGSKEDVKRYTTAWRKLKMAEEA